MCIQRRGVHHSPGPVRRFKFFESSWAMMPEGSGTGCGNRLFKSHQAVPLASDVLLTKGPSAEALGCSLQASGGSSPPIAPFR